MAPTFRRKDPTTPPAQFPYLEGIEALEGYLRLTENLLPDGWPESTEGEDHPAIRRRRLCEELISEHGTLRIPEQEALLPDIGEILLDALIFVEIYGGEHKSLRLGDIRNYGGPDKAKMIESRVTNPQHYLDILSELTFGAWHLSRGHDVAGCEEPGAADVRVRLPLCERPVVAECKRVRSPSKRRLQADLKKASRQIKKFEDDCYGIAFLHLTPGRPRKSKRIDKIPSWVERVARDTGAILQGRKNRGVGLAIIAWDDYLIGQDGTGYAQVTVRRNSTEVPHSPEPGVVDVPEHLPIFEGFGASVDLQRTATDED